MTAHKRIGAFVLALSLAANAAPVGQGEPNNPVNAWPFKLTDGRRNLTLLNAAPGSDTGQVGIPVRIISSLSLSSGSLTDTQLRASPVPVSGTFWQTTQPVSGTFWQATQPVSGTFWQATQPISAAALPLPLGASTESTLALIKAKTDNLDVALSTRTKPADTQTVSGTVTANAGTGTFAVSGTVTANAGSGTMAVSGPVTDAQLRASPVPVSGAFYPATQPVSGTVGVSGTVPVSGTFWQATQPVSGTFWQTTQPVSGSVTASQGGTWTVQPGNTANTTAWKVDGSAVTQPVSGTFWQATQPVSGTVTANAGSGTMAVSGPLTDTQLRASAVPVSGTFFQATQPISGTVSANATQTGTWTVQPGNTANTTAWKVDGSAVTQPVSGTVAANQNGTWTDRVVGSAGGAFDAANNAAAPANVLAQGDETITQGSQPTAATTGNVRRVVAALDGVQYARLGGPANWSCFLPLTTTATTQCLAAPGSGLRAYVVSLNCSNGAATVQGVDVVYGTGTNCGTGTTALTHKYQMGTNALTTSPYQADQSYGTGLVPAAANAICVRPTAATAFGCTLTGYTAP